MWKFQVLLAAQNTSQSMSDCKGEVFLSLIYQLGCHDIDWNWFMSLLSQNLQDVLEHPLVLAHIHFLTIYMNS
jgi:hypothetical protein